MGHICKGVCKYQEKAVSNAKVKADIDFLKQCTVDVATSGVNGLPTKAICTQLMSTTISAQPANPFGGHSGSGGNLFNTRAPQAPTSEVKKGILRASLALYPIQPQTTAASLSS